MNSTQNETRYLAVDLGKKRIGFAISGPGGIVSALEVWQAKPLASQNAQKIVEMADEYGVEAIVLGLPLHMDGTEGPQAAFSREMEKLIHERAPHLPVYLYDERLTSHAADAELAGRGFTRGQKKARQDAVAAKVLLESFLGSRQGKEENGAESG